MWIYLNYLFHKVTFKLNFIDVSTAEHTEKPKPILIHRSIEIAPINVQQN